MTTDARRQQLGDFLRSRRTALSRNDYGLPTLTRQRALGLRREEVSAFAGVSVTWYTWLEQGRDINPSRQVLDALGRVLRLTTAESDYLLSLGGFTPAPPTSTGVVGATPPHLQRLLDSLWFPAFALSPDWTITGWNSAYAALYPPISTRDPADRNLLWLVFTDPSLRDMLPNWEQDSRHFLAEFRGDSGAALSSESHSLLIARLRAASPEFGEQWADLAIERFASRRRRFLHPRAGVLEFEHHRLVPSDHPDLHIVTYLPDGSDTAAWFKDLAS